MPDRNDPFGFAFGPQRPESGFAPAIRPVTRDTHARSVLASAADLWARQWRAATSPSRFAGALGAAPKREGGPNSFDPTTRSGLDNWSAIFSPGPGRGGRMEQLTAADREFLASLQNVKTQRGLPDWLGEVYVERGGELSPVGEQLRSARYEPPPAPPVLDAESMRSIGPILEKLGSTIYGVDPLRQLGGSVTRDDPSASVIARTGREPDMGMFKDENAAVFETGLPTLMRSKEELTRDVAEMIPIKLLQKGKTWERVQGAMERQHYAKAAETLKGKKGTEQVVAMLLYYDRLQRELPVRQRLGFPEAN